MNIQINPKQFYTIGIVSFAIIGLMNLVNFFIFWGINNIFAKISSVFMILFNFSLVLFFNYLRNLEPIEETITESDDINEIIKKMQPKKSKKAEEIVK
jgi:hypothetical protein